MRKIPLVTGQIYHIFNRSIADFQIFNNAKGVEHMIQLLQYYQINNEQKFSKFIELERVQKEGFNSFFKKISTGKEKIVQIVAYCLMPTHIHLILKQLVENGISDFMRKVLDSYTRYFNLNHKRKGPLWEGKFKSVLIDNDNQLNHLIRYIHLNPVTGFLVDKPEDWQFSSYNGYLAKLDKLDPICQYDDIIKIDPSAYKKFVNDQISYQRELAKIKKFIFD